MEQHMCVTGKVIETALEQGMHSQAMQDLLARIGDCTKCLTNVGVAVQEHQTAIQNTGAVSHG